MIIVSYYRLNTRSFGATSGTLRRLFCFGRSILCRAASRPFIFFVFPRGLRVLPPPPKPGLLPSALQRLALSPLSILFRVTKMCICHLSHLYVGLDPTYQPYNSKFSDFVVAHTKISLLVVSTIFYVEIDHVLTFYISGTFSSKYMIRAIFDVLIPCLCGDGPNIDHVRYKTLHNSSLQDSMSM